MHGGSNYIMDCQIRVVTAVMNRQKNPEQMWGKHSDDRYQLITWNYTNAMSGHDAETECLYIINRHLTEWWAGKYRKQSSWWLPWALLGPPGSARPHPAAALLQGTQTHWDSIEPKTRNYDDRKKRHCNIIISKLETTGKWGSLSSRN